MEQLRHRTVKQCSVFVIICILLIPNILLPSLKPVAGQTPQELASKYAPVLHFVSGEKFYPVSVDYIIASSTLNQRMPDGSSNIIDPSPTPSTLGNYNSTDLFLNNKLSTLEAISADYAAKSATLGQTLYVHVVNTGSSTVIQYWLFYAYNNGPLNNHQADLEVVQIFLDASLNPVNALCSQHGSGEHAVWGDVERSDTHPVVYVAQGSHANYFRPYQGKIGIENDIVGNDGRTINPTDLTLILLGEKGSHPADQSWLDFPGRWGHLGTNQQVAAGDAGPYGPVFNQNGIRWSTPNNYLNSAFPVSNNYFILAWIAAYFLLIVAATIIARASWKTLGIIRLRKKGGLLVGRFLKSRGILGLILTITAIAITVAALALPWYTISASSQSGPLAGQGSVTLLKIDGLNGMQVNLFLGSGGDSTSGFTQLFFLQIPFAILIASGVILLALDVIGVRSGKKLGTKMMIGAITSLVPFIVIYAFIASLPMFLPLAAGLVPGQGIPPQLESIVRTIAGQPAFGTTNQVFPVIGSTDVNWGFGLGAYLFLAAAIVRVVAGIMVRRTPALHPGPMMEKPVAPSSPTSASVLVLLNR